MNPDQLVGTFVQDGSLFARLSSPDHQILYGRRGTGKTHALKYLAKTALSDGHVAVYVDLQSIGSTGGLYADPDLPIAEAGTRLLVDTLAAFHDQLRDIVFSGVDMAGTDELLPLLNDLSKNITEVQVRGEREWIVEHSSEASGEDTAGLAAGFSAAGPEIGASGRSRQAHSAFKGSSLKARGTTHHHVYFGAVSNTVKRLVEALPGRQLLILLDEWTDVPLYLQPLLADLIRRSLFPVDGVTVKIAAIEQRARFRVDRDEGGYVGIELGADAAADVDLDDFMVFGNNEEQAMDFFARLLSQHATVFANEGFGWRSPQEFLDLAFVSKDAFGELVRASEGVPRDAINIVAAAATRAGTEKISLKDVRETARDWYQRDKEKPVSEKPQARLLLHWIVDRVIGERQSRAFLLEQGRQEELIDWLYDARVLHVIKRGIASKHHAGVRFDAYAVDYGCYIDLLLTSRAPKGLFETVDETFIEVPPDNMEIIRGAILRVQDFLDEQSPISSSVLEVEWALKDHADAGQVPPEGSLGKWLCLEGESETAYLALRPGRYFIGSARHSDIRLSHHSVDENHAILEVSDREMKITCERHCRTYVNNGRVLSSELLPGDELRLGEVVLKVIDA